LCYAKITPAALHRGKSGEHCHGGGEAAGGKSKFELNEFRRVIAGSAMPVAPTPWMAPG
jgi:hypothetical protein